MPSVADKIMKRISEQDSRNWVCTPKDFLDLGSREAIDQALSRLVKAGRLRRIGTGLYDTPRTSRMLKRTAPVDMDAAIAAIARRDAVRILPDGLAAANQLGLTTVVPAKVWFMTDGPSRTIKFDLSDPADHLGQCGDGLHSSLIAGTVNHGAECTMKTTWGRRL